MKKTQLNVESKKLLALEGVTCSKIIAENLSVMHDALQLLQSFQYNYKDAFPQNSHDHPKITINEVSRQIIFCIEIGR